VATLEPPISIAGVQGGVTLEHQEDLLLAIPGVVVLGIGRGAGGQVQDVHPPRRHAQRPAEGPELDAFELVGTPVRLDLVDPPDGDIAHGRLLVVVSWRARRRTRDQGRPS
jgi:hypothetical protein